LIVIEDALLVVVTNCDALGNDSPLAVAYVVTTR
jgi:hypothetical protein